MKEPKRYVLIANEDGLDLILSLKGDWIKYSDYQKAIENNFSILELDILRQWFDCIKDINPKFLGISDKLLFRKIKSKLNQYKTF